MTSRGCTSTTPKQNNSHLSGKTPSSPRSKEANAVKLKVKSMFIVFDIRSLVHFEFVPSGQTVNQQFCKLVLEHLCDEVRRKRPRIRRTWILHHDNALTHTALSIKEFLTDTNIAIVPQTPYSSDLDPSEFFLFLNQEEIEKNTIRECRIDSRARD